MKSFREERFLGLILSVNTVGLFFLMTCFLPLCMQCIFCPPEQQVCVAPIIPGWEWLSPITFALFAVNAVVLKVWLTGQTPALKKTKVGDPSR